MAKERFFNLPVLILIASSFMLGMSEFIMVGILPDIAVGLKVSEVTVGNLVSLFAFVYAPVTPLGSALSARFPRFATHMTLIGVFLAGNLLCAFAPNYAVLMAGRILIALVSGTLVAIAMTYAPDVTTDTFRTKFIAWVFSGFSIASVVGVPVGTWVANAFGWRWAFHLVNALTVVLIIGMVAVLPRNSHAAKIGFLSQFRLFFDRRIQLGVLDVVCGAAASYVFYTYLTPIMRDEVHVPEQYLSVGLVIFGAACLWSNLYGGKLADRGRGVEPLTHIRPIYCAHAVLMASLIVAHWVAVLAAAVRTPLAVFAGVMVATLQGAAGAQLRGCGAVFSGARNARGAEPSAADVGLHRGGLCGAVLRPGVRRKGRTPADRGHGAAGRPPYEAAGGGQPLLCGRGRKPLL